MRMPKVERKVEYLPYEGEVKATNDSLGIVEGYLNRTSVIDFGDDRSMPGCFKRTIADSYARKASQGLDFLFPYLWNHSYDILPPGGIFEANEDKNGLYIKTQFNLDIQLGREIYSSFRAGTLKKQSMGYRAIKYEYVKEDGRNIRNLLEVAVVEGSAVTFPMCDLAIVDVVKGSTGKRTFVMPGEKQDPSKLNLEDHISKRLEPPQKKDFNATYQERMQSDWLDDLWNLWFALKSEIINAFRIGDQPVEDVQAALDQFSQAMLAYVQQGVDLGMVEALQPDEDDNSPVYGYMSNPDVSGAETKEGRMLSAANHATMTKAVGGIMEHCKSMNNLLQSAKPQKSLGADDSLPQQDEQKEAPQDDAVSTHLGELLASIQLANIGRQLKLK